MGYNFAIHSKPIKRVFEPEKSERLACSSSAHGVVDRKFLPCRGEVRALRLKVLQRFDISQMIVLLDMDVDSLLTGRVLHLALADHIHQVEVDPEFAD